MTRLIQLCQRAGYEASPSDTDDGCIAVVSDGKNTREVWNVPANMASVKNLLSLLIK